MSKSAIRPQTPLLTAKYLEKKIRRFFEFLRARFFSFSRVNPRLARRLIKTSRPDQKKSS